MAAEPDTWGAVLSRIVQGFTHDLNNRVLVLVGVRDLMEPPHGADSELLELFDRELDGLERETRLLRRLVVPDEEPEVVDPGEILETARQLHRRHRGLHALEHDWKIPGGLPAIRVRPSALLRALLLALAAVGETALRDGVDRVEVRAAGDDGLLRVTLGPAKDAAAPALLAARALLGGDGRLEHEDGACRIDVPAIP